MVYYAVQNDAVIVGVTSFSGSISDTMQTAVNLASSNGLPLIARPGVYAFGNVSISSPISFRGVQGEVTFQMTSGATGILYLGAFGWAELEGIIFDGNNNAFSSDPNIPVQGLINMRRDSSSLMSKATFRLCTFQNSTICGLSTNQVRVQIENCYFSSCASYSAGIYASDEVTILNSRFENQDVAVHCITGATTNAKICGNIILRCRRNGIAFEPSGAAQIDQNIIVAGNIIAKLASSDTWAVSRTDTTTTGGEGNGILAYLCTNVVISNNEISDCQFSAIRCNASTTITISGNICQRSGETSLYVESSSSISEYEATISGNVIDGGGAGIAVVNFNNGGRFSTITGNLVQNISSKTITYSAGSYATTGVGIYVEGDATVSNNTIWTAYFGLALGTTSYSSDLNASGNIVRSTTLGIGVSTSNPKNTLITGNLIAGYSSGAIMGFTYNGSSSPPVAASGSELSPANLGSATSGNIFMIGNIKRATL